MQDTYCLLDGTALRETLRARDLELQAAKEHIAMKDEALKLTREELRACQAAIHLSGDFDTAYVTCAQAAMKIADKALSATSETTEAFLNEVRAKALEDAAGKLRKIGHDSTAKALRNMAEDIRAKNGG